MKLADIVKTTVPTMEMIHFQRNDPFGPSLEAIITEITTKYTIETFTDKSVIDKYSKSISKLVRDRFGMNVEVVLDGDLARANPDMLTDRNVMISKDFIYIYRQSQQVKLASLKKIADGGSLGVVDLKAAKISGYISTIPVKFSVNILRLFEAWEHSVKEIAAITLHEIGHLFHAFEYSTRINTTNQILAEVASTILSSKGDKIDIIYRSIKKIDPEVSREIAEQLASGKSAVLAAGVWKLLGITGASLTGKHYDDTQFEAMSDQFAARFGYGEYSASTLAWIEEIDPETGAIRDATVYLTKLYVLAAVVTGFGIFGAVLGSTVILSILSIICCAIGGKLFGDAVKWSRRSSYGITYDDAKDRVKRIRNQLVEDLKRRKRDDKSIPALLDSIKTVDGYIANIPKTKDVFWTSMTDFIFPKDRRIKDGIEDQQLIEALIANDLFINSHKLKELSL